MKVTVNVNLRYAKTDERAYGSNRHYHLLSVPSRIGVERLNGKCVTLVICGVKSGKPLILSLYTV